MIAIVKELERLRCEISRLQSERDGLKADNEMLHRDLCNYDTEEKKLVKQRNEAVGLLRVYVATTPMERREGEHHTSVEAFLSCVDGDV